MSVNLASGLCAENIKVDFILDKRSAAYIETAHHAVNFLVNPENRIDKKNYLLKYLQTQTPQILLVFKEEDIIKTSKIFRKNKLKTKLIARTGTALKSRQKQRHMNRIRRWLKNRQMNLRYQQADGHIAVAEGTKQELQEIIQLPAEQIKVIKNPVITPALLSQQHEVIDHPWFNDNSKPLIIGMGGFRQQKDFTTLIKAVAKAKETKPCRLVLLGQGRQQQRLEQLAKELGIADDVSFPGFTSNPYPWLKRADLFVLSSLWEGSPNVITEALALGTPVVSTDCQSGPRETLQDGRYGQLVPLKDSEAMAEAIINTLDNPLPSDKLQQAVADYTVEASCAAYIKAFESFLGKTK